MEVINHYTKKEEEFRAMTLDEILNLKYGERIWLITNKGQAAQVKVNGKVKRWKRNPERFLVPVKYGLFECESFGNSDSHRFLVKV